MNEIREKLNEDKKRLISYSTIYFDAYLDLDRVQEVQYSSGGEILLRGYYNPSPVYDLVIGNVNRGRLIKKISDVNKINYKYFFDKFNKLIFIEKYSKTKLIEKENIFYLNNVVIGFTYSLDGKLKRVSELTFNDSLPTSYIYIIFTTPSIVGELYKEEYLYFENNLQSAIIYNFLSYINENYNCIPEKDIIIMDKYNFISDDKGYLSQYNRFRYNNLLNYNQDKLYSIRVKRKISKFINDVLYCYIVK